MATVNRTDKLEDAHRSLLCLLEKKLLLLCNIGTWCACVIGSVKACIAMLGPIFTGCYHRFVSLMLTWIQSLFESLQFAKYGYVIAMVKLLETFWNTALEGKFVGNLFYVRIMDVMAAKRQKTNSQEIRFGKLIKYHLNILIAHILNYTFAIERCE